METNDQDMESDKEKTNDTHVNEEINESLSQKVRFQILFTLYCILFLFNKNDISYNSKIHTFYYYYFL